MNNYQEAWMDGICDALNDAGIKVPKGSGLRNDENTPNDEWSRFRFENSIELMKYITRNESLYDFLNTKGLVNMGNCPVSGQKISIEHYWQLFGRKVYISDKGVEMCKEWDRKQHLKIHGKELLSEKEIDMIRQQVKFEIGEKKKGVLITVIIILIVVLLLVKKCTF